MTKAAELPTHSRLVFPSVHGQRPLFVWIFLGILVGTPSAFAEEDVPPLAIPADTIQAGRPVGTLPGRLSVDPLGRARYTVPLDLPEGPNRFSPHLRLQYANGGPNGLLGVGWSLVGPSVITRCYSSFAREGGVRPITFDDTDRLCLDGEPLLVVRGVYGADGAEYRLEKTPAVRVLSEGREKNSPRQFRVFYKDGRVSVYATLFAAHRVGIHNPLLPVKPDPDRSIYGWGLSHSEDRSGNRIEMDWLFRTDPLDESVFSYYPLRLRYSFADDEEGLREIGFNYQDPAPRSDIVDRYISGFHLRIAYRLNTIRVYAPDGTGEVSLLRSYELSYKMSPSTHRSLLNQLKLCDRDQVCLPPTTFEWSETDHDFEAIDLDRVPALVSEEPEWIPSSALEISGRNVHIGDFNGDGRDDLLQKSNSSSPWFLRLGTRSGLKPWVTTGLSADIKAAMDVDGEPGTEIVVEEDDGLQVLRLSESGAFDRLVQKLGPHTEDPTLDPWLFAADLDGDGRPNIVRSENGQWIQWSNAARWGLPFATARATGVAPNWHDPGFFGAPSLTRALRYQVPGRTSLMTRVSGQTFAIHATHGGETRVELVNHKPDPAEYMIDINGDGLDDVVDAWAGRARLNTGQGFLDWHPIIDPRSGNSYVPTEQTTDTSLIQDWGVQSGDFNADGRGDFSVTSRKEGVVLYLSLGKHFDKRVLLRPEELYDDDIPEDEPAFRHQWLDVDGNGSVDILVRGRQLRLHRRKQGRSDFIVSVQNGLKQKDYIEYASTTDEHVYQSGSPCAYPQRCDMRRRPVVKRLLRDGGSGVRESLYGYRGARANVRGSGFLGFERVRRMDRAQNRITETHYDLAARTDRYHTRVGVPVKIVSVTMADDDEALVVIRNRRLSTTQSFGGRVFFTRVTEEVRSRYALLNVGGLVVPDMDEGLHSMVDAWMPQAQVEIHRRYDRFANLIYERASIPGGESRERSMEVENNEEPWLIGQVKREIIRSTAADGAEASTERVANYDTQGRLTKTILEPEDSSRTLMTTLRRRPTGQVVEVEQVGVVGPVRRTRIGWDAEGIYTSWVENAEGHIRRTAVHPGFGVRAVEEDENKAITVYKYDGFGRLVSQKEPNGRETTHHFQEKIDGTFDRISHTNAGSSIRVEYDRLGRRVRVGQQAQGTWAEVHWAYDLAGRVTAKSLPHFQGDVVHFVRRNYDGAGRLLEIQYPNGTSTRRAYSPSAIHFWDTGGNYARINFGSDGQVEASTNRIEDREITHRYEYGPHGRLQRVYGPSGLVMSATYDPLGRRVRIEDANAGVRTTTYNVFGEVTAEHDGDGGARFFERDRLGRIYRIDDGSGISEIAWDAAYGPSGAMLRNRVSRTVSPDGVALHYEYDDLGRQTKRTVEVEGQSYSLGRTFDTQGRVDAVTYPRDGAEPFSVSYRYDADGLLNTVIGPDGSKIWQSAHRDAFGHADRVELGEKLQTNRAFDGRTGRLTQIRTFEPGSPEDSVMHLSYQYHPTGHVRSETNDIHGVANEYSYDELVRLTGWTTRTAEESQTFGYAYDGIGNMTWSRGMDGEKYYSHGDGAGPHSVTAVDGQPIRYDALGRRVETATESVEYTPFDLPKRIEGARGTVEYDYAVGGQRIRTKTNRGEVVSMDGLFERRSLDGATEESYFIWAESQVIAEIVRTDGEPSMRYFHRDAIGSPRVITDADGRVLEERDYTPFGTMIRRGASGLEDYRGGFTGHRHDAETGFVNMGGRIYDPNTRRFLTPDPFVHRPYFGPSFNRYSYVLNAPLTLVDPTGFQETDPDYDDGDCVGHCDMEAASIFVDRSGHDQDPDGSGGDGPAWSSGDGYGNGAGYDDGYVSHSQDAGDSSDGFDRGGHGDPSLPDEQWQTSYELPRSGVTAITVTVVAAGGGQYASASGGLATDGGGSSYPVMSHARGFSTGTGLSVSLDFHHNSGRIESFGGASYVGGASASGGAGLAAEHQRPVSSPIQGNGTTTMSFVTGSPGAEVHAGVGYTWVGRASQGGGFPEQVYRVYGRTMTERGYWVRFGEGNALEETSMSYWVGPFLAGSGPRFEVAPNACLYPASR